MVEFTECSISLKLFHGALDSRMCVMNSVMVTSVAVEWKLAKNQ